MQPEDIMAPSLLLKPLEGLCIVKTLDWWTYEVCHQAKVILDTPSPPFPFGASADQLAIKTP